MDDVFLNEHNSHLTLNDQEDWDSVAEQVSFLPVNEGTENELDVLAVQMDIGAPLSFLKAVLAQKLGLELGHYQIWLQDILQLNDENTLAEQCVQGEGLVQVNLELKSVASGDRINIIDVLKPQTDLQTDVVLLESDAGVEIGNCQDVIHSSSEPILSSEACLQDVEACPKTIESIESKYIPSTSVAPVKNISPVGPSSTITGNKSSQPQATSNENITRWVMDSAFRKEQDRLKIPIDPALWTTSHVQHWIQWSIKQFKLKNVTASQWISIDGLALCSMSHAEFTEKVGSDPSDLFWTHLELLRKCKFVGVIQKPVPYLQYVTTPLSVKGDVKTTVRSYKAIPTKVQVDPVTPIISGNRTGNNGQVQLWQFLLELLTDKNSRDYISWLGTEGEFKLNNPEMVAQLWGERKNKPHMNYEKLSRALRYYYDGDMICKVHGKRFVYKFVCDLKHLLGYSADELNNLVIECEQRFKMSRSVDP